MISDTLSELSEKIRVNLHQSGSLILYRSQIWRVLCCIALELAVIMRMDVTHSESFEWAP